MSSNIALAQAAIRMPLRVKYFNTSKHGEYWAVYDSERNWNYGPFTMEQAKDFYVRERNARFAQRV